MKIISIVPAMIWGGFMESLKKDLMTWIDELENFRMPEWDSLPDIDLYMDQVITYLEKQLSILACSEDDKFITPAMINNYVKNEIIPRPVQKKYNRDHIALLIAVLSLKPILPLADITSLISQGTADKPIDALFEKLSDIQFDAFKKTSCSVREALKKLENDPAEDENEEHLSLLALKFSLEANAYRIAAKKILSELIAYNSRIQENTDGEDEKSNGKHNGRSGGKKEKGKEKAKGKQV